MIRAYLANGTLAATVDAKDSIMALDTVTWAYISGLLGTGHCYLVLGGREVIKVIGVEVPNIALIQRGIDSTCVRTWPSNTSVTYGLTESEINDAITVLGNSITALGALQESNGVVSYEGAGIVGIGGCTVDGSDEGIWMIQNLSGATGCCSIAGQSPPPIPLQYLSLRAVTEGYYRVCEDGSYRAYI